VIHVGEISVDDCI